MTKASDWLNTIRAKASSSIDSQGKKSIILIGFSICMLDFLGVDPLEEKLVITNNGFEERMCLFVHSKEFNSACCSNGWILNNNNINNNNNNSIKHSLKEIVVCLY